MSEKKEKRITSELVTSWEPDISWNLWKEQPKEGKEGVPRPEEERVAVEISWPTAEEFDRLTSQSSATAMFFALTRACITSISGFSFKGEGIESGAELVSVRSPGARRCRDLAINIGSHIFRESLLEEDEVKN